jgi:hypothetical protein
MGQIQFDENGESQAFEIGHDRIYFFYESLPERGRPHSEGEAGAILVAHAEAGEPYSRTTAWIRFEDHEEAERFLAQAQAQDCLPPGWQ